eukprot:12424937-Prorocentrum_lima.AAC.1
MASRSGPGQAASQERWSVQGRWHAERVVKRPAFNGLLGVRVGEPKNPGPEGAGDEAAPGVAGVFRCPLCP